MIFIVPNRIEKIRLKRFKEKCRSKQIDFQEVIDCQVTHVVSELDNIEAVYSRLKLTGSLLQHVRANSHVLNTGWLTACLKAGKLVKIEDDHKIPHSRKEKVEKSDRTPDKFAEWACMRDTPLYHHNHHITEALEILEKDANYVGGETNYSRALAFRRCIATLAALPQKVVRIEEVSALPHVGGHCRQVIEEILEHGSSNEVERIRDSKFHKTMKVLTGIFGVGEATAKKWMNAHDIHSVEEARAHARIKDTQDERLQYGLAFHEDLSLPVLISEAEALRELVYQEASAILPGVTVEVTGGFRRGKRTGHDIDFLLSHPVEGKEKGLLAKLIDRLFRRGLYLYGKVEGSSFTEDKLSEDTRLNYLKSNLDHFEKFVGILKLDKDNRTGHEKAASSGQKSYEIKSKTNDRQTKDQNYQTASSENHETQTNCSIHSPSHAASAHLYSAPIESQQSPDSEPPTKIRKQTTLTSLLADASSKDRKWYARRVDIVIAPASQYYYALVGWTGSKSFNRDLRLYATKVHNKKLTSHGLYDLAQKKRVSASSEREVFESLGLEYRDPKLRNC